LPAKPKGAPSGILRLIRDDARFNGSVILSIPIHTGICLDRPNLALDSLQHFPLRLRSHFLRKFVNRIKVPYYPKNWKSYRISFKPGTVFVQGWTRPISVRCRSVSQVAPGSPASSSTFGGVICPSGPDLEPVRRFGIQARTAVGTAHARRYFARACHPMTAKRLVASRYSAQTASGLSGRGSYYQDNLQTSFLLFGNASTDWPGPRTGIILDRGRLETESARSIRIQTVRVF